MSQSDEVAEPDYFDLKIARFAPKRRVDECRIKTVGELDERLAEIIAEPMLAIGLGCVAEEADWGHIRMALT